MISSGSNSSNSLSGCSVILCDVISFIWEKNIIFVFELFNDEMMQMKGICVIRETNKIIQE